MEKLLTVAEFARRYNLKANTIIRNIDLIKGVVEKDGEYFFPDSSRYPYFKHNIKVDTKEAKKYVLLYATSRYLYVDEEIIKLSYTSFETMVNELVEKELLVLNGSNNEYGLNKYDVTDKASIILDEGKRGATMYLAQLFGVAAGTFCATYGNISN